MKTRFSGVAARRAALLAALIFAVLFVVFSLPHPTSHAAVPAATPTPVSGQTVPRFPIKHIIIIDKENRSFDTMFGQFPGADGTTHAQLSSGKVVRLGHTPDRLLLDVGHAGEAATLAVNNGRMNRFNLLPGAIQDGRDVAVSQYAQRDIPNYWRYAGAFTLDDHFFSTIMGPSFPNHLATIAAQSGTWRGKVTRHGRRHATSSLPRAAKPAASVSPACLLRP